MYRNIHFDNYSSTMHLWTWDEDGNPVVQQHTFKPYIYIESKKESELKTIYDTYVHKIEFPNVWEKNRYLKDGQLERIFFNLRPEQQFLIEQFGCLNNDPSFSKHNLNIAFIDIEVYTCKYDFDTKVKCKDGSTKYIDEILSLPQEEINELTVYDKEAEEYKLFHQSCYTQTSEFPDAEEAKYPINVITMYSTNDNMYYTWGIHQPYTHSRKDVKYIQCDTEFQLLSQFLDFWENNYPDVVSGWNSFGFDIPYIVNRISNVLGDRDASRLSPVNSIYYRPNVVNIYGKDVGKWYINGLTSLDYMELYQKFSQGETPNNTLNFIGEKELGKGKVKYNATDLSKLAITDWQTFIDYNIQDVNILVDLDVKLQYINLARVIAYKGLCTLEASTGTIGVVTGALAQKAMEQGMIIPTFTNHESSRNYEGGYVRPPKSGLQTDIVSFDANSLYPNTIITLNISPETKLGKVLDKSHKGVTIELVDGTVHTLTSEKFVTFLKRSNACVSKAKIIYSQNTKGFCPEAIESIYQERVETRKKLHQAKLLEKRISKILQYKKNEQ